MASGKGTVSKLLAKELNFAYLDTGLLFRYVAWLSLQNNVDLNDSKAVACLANKLDIKECCHSDELRTEEISQAASVVAQYKGVRDALLLVERAAPHNLPASLAGIVVDGRDTGTVVFPDADVKFYITADQRERAERRFKELQSRGELCILGDVLQELTIRDDRDAKRGVSPLKIPRGAFVIDTTSIDPKATVKKMLEVVHSANLK